ncbi:MAG: sulfate permease [Deltaproteobacteria bacterium]|nr:sulfate permease [Deltaproteobacteria bacterium]
MPDQRGGLARLLPESISTLREGYGAQHFLHDLGAGLIVGVVALPLAIAFGIASGVKPEQGLVTAVVAGFLISALGGSRVQIGGPTGAFIVIVYGIVQQFGYDGLVVATLLAGVMLVLLGLSGLGAMIHFVPYPVTVGFTAGIALVIASSQVRDLLGLSMEAPPADFLEKVAAYAEHLGSTNPSALLLGAATVLLVVGWPRVTHKVPGSLVAIVACTALAQLADLPVETIGSRFGGVPTALPVPHLPRVDWETVRMLFSPAIAIALLAAIESLLSAVVADGMTGHRHRPDAELVAQGVANIGSALFGGIPATGAIARTATNIKSGGRTPVAGIVHALTLLAIMLLFGKWASLIPMPVLAGILLVVAYNMSEWRLFVRLFRSPRSDILVLLSTFALTVLVDLIVALQVGIVLAAFLFMRRMSGLSQAGFITRSLATEEDSGPNAIDRREVPPGVEVFEIYGPFFFGAASKFKSAIARVESPPRVLILRMREVHVMDATALRALEDVVKNCRRDGIHLILSGVHAQPLLVLERSRLLQDVGEEQVFDNIDAALARARELLAQAG